MYRRVVTVLTEVGKSSVEAMPELSEMTMKRPLVSELTETM
jgi:hypothetical protein